MQTKSTFRALSALEVRGYEHFSAVVGCGNRADRDRDISSLAIVTVKGEKSR